MITKRILGGRNPGGRPGRRPVEAENPEPGLEAGRPGGAEEEKVDARGVIRLEQVCLLTRYRTAYGLYDRPTAGYDCALKSDVYRLADWVGEYVEVTGTLSDVGEELPVMDVTRLRLLKNQVDALMVAMRTHVGRLGGGGCVEGFMRNRRNRPLGEG